MIVKIQQKQPLLPISSVLSITYTHEGCMITIGKIPQKVKSFFRPVHQQVSAHVYAYYCHLALALCISHGEFLWRSRFDEMAVRAQALNLLKHLRHKNDKQCLLILDDTQTIKRAKKMEAVGKIHHHATGTYRMGHTILKACLYYRGITIPFGSWLYVKKEHAQTIGVPFMKLTEMAGQTARQAALPRDLEVTVLFDAFYLCPAVTKACQERNWRYISVSKANRRLTVGSATHKVGSYGRNVLRRGGAWYSIKGLQKTGRYQLASRTGTMKKLGPVKVVFSRRKGDRAVVALPAAVLKIIVIFRLVFNSN